LCPAVLKQVEEVRAKAAHTGVHKNDEEYLREMRKVVRTTTTTSPLELLVEPPVRVKLVIGVSMVTSSISMVTLSELSLTVALVLRAPHVRRSFTIDIRY